MTGSGSKYSLGPRRSASRNYRVTRGSERKGDIMTTEKWDLFSQVDPQTVLHVRDSSLRSWFFLNRLQMPTPILQSCSHQWPVRPRQACSPAACDRESPERG